MYTYIYIYIYNLLDYTIYVVANREAMPKADTSTWTGIYYLPNSC